MELVVLVDMSHQWQEGFHNNRGSTDDFLLFLH